MALDQSQPLGADSSQYTPETLARRYAMAQQLLAGNKAPILTAGQGVLEGLSHILGGVMLGKTEQDERSARSDAMQQIIAALSGGQGQPPVGGASTPGTSPQPDAVAPPINAPTTPSAPVTPVDSQPLPTMSAPPVNPDLRGMTGLTTDAPQTDQAGVNIPIPPMVNPAYASAIAGNESAGSGGYTALGPQTKSGDRAYGKYQVMGSNIPQWTKDATGKSLSPAEFLASPAIQDAVFQKKFGDLVQQYGNPQDAASAWFTGKPLAQGAGMADQLGTTGQAYVDKFNTGLASPTSTIAAALQGGPASPYKVAGPMMPPPSGDPMGPSVAPSPQDIAAAVQASGPAAVTGAPPPPVPPVAAGQPPGVKSPNAALIAAMLNPWTPPGVAAALGTQMVAKPQFTQIGEDPNTGFKQFGFVNPVTQEITPANPAGGNSAAANPAVQGDDYLKTLPQGRQDLIKGMLAGRITPPSLGRAGSPIVMGLLQDAARVDPGFDATQWNARLKARTEFNAGGTNSPAGQITSGNTAIGHLGLLSDKAEALDNFENLGPLNMIANKGLEAYRGANQDPRLVDFNAVRNKYIEEATKFYRGTGGNEGDLQRDIADLNAANTPTQLRTVINTQAHLMNSKVEALQQRWKNALGPGAGDFPIISQNSQDALDKIDSRMRGNAKSSNAAPSNGLSDADAALVNKYLK